MPANHIFLLPIIANQRYLFMNIVSLTWTLWKPFHFFLFLNIFISFPVLSRLTKSLCIELSSKISSASLANASPCWIIVCDFVCFIVSPLVSECLEGNFIYFSLIAVLFSMVRFLFECFFLFWKLWEIVIFPPACVSVSWLNTRFSCFFVCFFVYFSQIYCKIQTLRRAILPRAIIRLCKSYPYKKGHKNDCLSMKEKDVRMV